MWIIDYESFKHRYFYIYLNIGDDEYEEIKSTTQFKHTSIASKSFYYISSLIEYHTGEKYEERSSIDKAHEALLTYKIHIWTIHENILNVIESLYNIQNINRYFSAIAIKSPSLNPENPDIVLYCRPLKNSNDESYAKLGLDLILQNLNEEWGCESRLPLNEIKVNNLITYIGGNTEDKSIILNDKCMKKYMDIIYDETVSYALYKDQKLIH
jgi:hypothetical protein